MPSVDNAIRNGRPTAGRLTKLESAAYRRSVEPRGDPRLEAAIRAVGAWRGRDIGVTPVSIGEEDRHFLIEADDELFVLRLANASAPVARAAVSTEIEVARAAAAAGVAPELLEYLPQFGCLITRFATGRRLSSGVVGDDQLTSIVGSVRALHACPAPNATRSVFRDAEDLRHAAISSGTSMPDVEPAATRAMRRIEAATTLEVAPAVTCHGDLTRASLCFDRDHVWIVDFRWAGAGDAFEDLGSLAAHLDLSDEHADRLLRLYFGSSDDARRAQLDVMRLAAEYVAAMRALSRGTASGPPGRAQDADRRLAQMLDDTATDRFDRSVRVVAARR